MMVDVQTDIQIKCSIKEVATFASDPDNAPKWYVNIKMAEWKTPKPLSVGSKIAFMASFLGRKLEYIYEIVELIPLEKMMMRTADGPFPMETTYTWETVEGDQTRITLRNRGMPSGFSKWVAPLMVSAMRRANKKDLSRLKMILEKESKK